jgi:hypothetical protein
MESCRPIKRLKGKKKIKSAIFRGSPNVVLVGKQWSNIGGSQNVPQGDLWIISPMDTLMFDILLKNNGGTSLFRDVFISYDRENI